MEKAVRRVETSRESDWSALRHYDEKAYLFLQSVMGRNGLPDASSFVVDDLSAGRSEHIIHTHRINDIRTINAFFRGINRRLVHGGTFIGCFENIAQRKARMFNSCPSLLAYPAYYGLDLLWKRLLPAIPFMRKMHRAVTGDVDRRLSTTEVLGRLVFCGFEINHFEEVGGLTWFYARKEGFPKHNEDPGRRTLLKLQRIGRGGRYKEYFKLRTMYPYAEHLQGYLFEHNGTDDGDKPRDDFRITRWGAFLRRYWLDELPMLINYLKGDLKLVGVRPVSDQKFETYPEWLQRKRINYKPGLIPPFYADMPETVEEFAETERRYLERYDRAPLKTDVTYFFKALYNILFRGARSK